MVTGVAVIISAARSGRMSSCIRSARRRSPSVTMPSRRHYRPHARRPQRTLAHRDHHLLHRIPGPARRSGPRCASLPGRQGQILSKLPGRVYIANSSAVNPRARITVTASASRSPSPPPRSKSRQVVRVRLRRTEPSAGCPPRRPAASRDCQNPDQRAPKSRSTRTSRSNSAVVPLFEIMMVGSPARTPPSPRARPPPDAETPPASRCSKTSPRSSRRRGRLADPVTTIFRCGPQ